MILIKVDKMMKKIKTILLVVTILLVLTGCMKASVNYGIDEKYNAYVVYDIAIDTKEMNRETLTGLRIIIEDFIDMYEKEGFIFEGEYEDVEIMEFTLTLKKQGISYEDAFNKLEEIINDPKISFILLSDMSFRAEEYEQAILFQAETDISKIIATTSLNDLPPSIKDKLYYGLEASEISFSLTLPHINIIELNNEVQVDEKNKKTTLSFPLKIDGLSAIKLIARMSLDNSKMVPTTIDQSIQNTKDQIAFYQVLSYIGIGGAVLSIGFLVFYIVKKKK